MFRQISRRFRNWYLGAYTRRRLGQFDDHLLQDIGTDRDDLDRFVAASLKARDFR